VNKQVLQKARWWVNIEKKSAVQCLLCPRQCKIRSGEYGFCGIRKNIASDLYSIAYGRPVAIHIDPIEKKPFYEFLPGSYTFSLGTYGCNLDCLFCQNHHISRGKYSETELNEYIQPETLVALAKKYECKSIAFTYNEPIVWAEYFSDIAECCKRNNLATLLVSNAYVNLEAASDIFKNIDAANFDMKGFSQDFYKNMTSGSLKNILAAIKYFFSLGKHLELTNLIIPGKNDSEEQIESYLFWVKENLNLNIPLHFSAYHPDYLLSDIPPTPKKTLLRILEKSKFFGFNSVYLGNIGL